MRSVPGIPLLKNVIRIGQKLVMLVMVCGLSLLVRGEDDGTPDKPVQPAPREFLVLTGGPALRFFEHGKAGSHDVYWFNFIDASEIRLKQLLPRVAPQDRLTWLVFRPSYERRGAELGRDLVGEITKKAAALPANLVWFNDTNGLIEYLNKGTVKKRNRHQWPIANFDYIGHSNKAAFLFDYSNQIDGLSLCLLHVNDLRRIRDDIFTQDATCQSWGCHSGELYSPKWRHRFDVPMRGANGKTDFSQGGLPVLSDPVHGQWLQ